MERYIKSTGYTLVGEWGFDIRKVIATFDVQCIGFPFCRIIITVHEPIETTGQKHFTAVPNVIAKDPETKEHEGCYGSGVSIEEAVFDLLNTFISQCKKIAKNKELEITDFAFTQPYGYYD